LYSFPEIPVPEFQTIGKPLEIGVCFKIFPKGEKAVNVGYLMHRSIENKGW